MITRLRYATLASLLLASPLVAQVAHPGIGVRVRAPGVLFDRFEGVYLGHAGDTLLLGNDDRGPVRVPSAAVTQLELSRGRSHWKGALRGALWGAGIGVALGALTVASTTPEDSISGSEKASFLATMTAGGAELGAIIGAIVGRRVWVATQPSVLLTAAMDRPRVAVRVAIGRTPR